MKYSIIPELINSKKIIDIPLNYKMKYGVILVFLLFSMSFVLAETTSWIDDTLTIEISNISNVPNFTEEFIEFNVTFISKKDPFNNYDFIFRLSGNGNESLFISEDNIKYRVIINDTAENIDFANKYFECLEDKIGFERGWQNCQNDLVEYKGENTTLCKEDLGACLLDVKSKDIEISGKEDKIKTLENEKETTKNSKWFYAIVAFVLGIVAYMAYEGKFVKGSAKDKSMSEFSKSQSG